MHATLSNRDGDGSKQGQRTHEEPLPPRFENASNDILIKLIFKLNPKVCTMIDVCYLVT